MTSPIESVLPKSDRLLLRGMGYIVPSSDRNDWLRFWEAELWWRRYPPSREAHNEFFTDLSIGLCHDAFWLRLDSWGRVLRGTAVICLLTLGISCFLSVLLAICLYGGWYGLQSQFLPQFGHFLFASPLIRCSQEYPGVALPRRLRSGCRFPPLMAALGARVDHAGAARFSV